MTNPDQPPVTRFSQLRGAPVHDADDQQIGHVSDLRLRPEPRRGQPTLTVTAIILDRRHTGALLGYERTRQQGPWLIRIVMQALHRRAALIPWTAVHHITTDPDGQHRIHLTPTYSSRTPEID